MFGKVHYAKVNLPSDATLNWTSTDPESTATQSHSIHLTGLTGDSEYVFRVASADDASFAKAMVSSYQRLVTETTQPSVTIQAPGTDLVISGTVTFSVVASDTVSRFSDGGISSVQLGVDDIILASPSHTAGSNVYEFTLDTTQLKRGIHQVTASAVDDFGNAAECSIEYYIDNTGGYSGQSAGPRTAITQAQASSTKSPLNKQPRGVVSKTSDNRSIEIWPENPAAVMIHTSKSLEADLNKMWPSPHQKKAGYDNQIMVTIKNLDPTNWYRLVLLDPPDLSPYSSRNPGDNIGIEGQWGGPRGYYTFLPENEGTEYEKKAFEDRELPGRWVQLKVKAARDGVARFRLVLRRGQQRGNNYRVKLFHLHGSQKGQMIAESGDIVAWDRVYLEIDRMKRGVSFCNNGPTDFDTAHGTTFRLRGIGAAAKPGDLIHISDDDNKTGEYVTVQSTSGGYVTLVPPGLAGTYRGDRNGIITLLDQTTHNPLVIDAPVDESFVFRAFGSIEHPRGEDAGCFVDFVDVPSSKNAHPLVRYRASFTRASAADLLNPCLDNDRHNVIHVAYGDNASKADGSIASGLTDSGQYWTFVAAVYCGDATAAGKTLEHELMHQFEIGTGSWSDDEHKNHRSPAEDYEVPYLLNGSTAYGYCLMDYDYKDSDPYVGFCQHHERWIREWPWP